MGRTIISADDGRRQGGPGAPYDRASPDACTRHDLQARTLSSRRTTPRKFDERRWRKGTGEDFGTNQGEGNHARVRRPSRQLYNGTEGDSRGSHYGAVTSRQSLRGSHFTAVTWGSHFGAVTSGQSPHCQSASATRFQPLPLSGRRNSPRRHNVSVIEVCSILPYPPPPCYPTGRPCIASIKVQI